MTLVGMVLLALLSSSHMASAYYDPGVQRWVNRDPLEETGGINLYRFVLNQPLSQIDPFGETDIPAWCPFVGGGRVCNDSDHDIIVMTGNGDYHVLHPGECTSRWDDCDGYWDNGIWHPIHNGNGTRSPVHNPTPPWGGGSSDSPHNRSGGRQPNTPPSSPRPTTLPPNSPRPAPPYTGGPVNAPSGGPVNPPLQRR